MTVRASQTPEYWGDAFTLTADDREFLLNLFIEDEQPRATDQLAAALIRYRAQCEETALRRKQQGQGTLYQPKRAFQLGEPVVFPALDFAVGQVAAIRDGYNPDNGRFKVIEVELAGARREFAAEFAYEHHLNEDAAILSPTEIIISPEDLYKRYAGTFVPHLRQLLHASSDFVWLAGNWFPRALIADLNAGQLNIAEAILDMNGGGPLSTAAILPELGVAPDINRNLQIFSLNDALYNDGRFDEVGPAGEVLWYLVRLEPASVLRLPDRLAYAPQPYAAQTLSPDLIKIERALDDEWSDVPVSEDALDDEATFTLTYPHRRAGTVPLSPTTARLFPDGRTRRIRFLFEDARTGQRWPGWVVRERRYAFGLDAWYAANDVPTGAYVQLARGDEPGVVVVDLQGHRPRREWVRVAVLRDNRLMFEMLKRPIPCDYDDQLIVIADDTPGLDQLTALIAERGTPLHELILQLLPELAKLSPQRNAHVKTLYAALNLLRRLPPGPLFAALLTQTLFRALGDGYWLAR